mgnify:CR=1 FL=1
MPSNTGPFGDAFAPPYDDPYAVTSGSTTGSSESLAAVRAPRDDVSE